MATLKVHDTGSAPNESKHALEEVKHRYGQIPNLWGTLANSPVLLNGYTALNHQWDQSSLTAKEREIVFLSASVANQCPYCMAGYTAGLRRMNVNVDIIRQVLDNDAVEDPKLNALVSLVKEMVNNRGFVSGPVLEAFLAAGYAETTVLEILVGVAMKTMANYLDHLFPIPIDEAYSREYQKVVREGHE